VTERALSAADGPIRSVLVHLDGSDAAAERLRVACRIGRRFGAHVFAQFCTDPTIASLQLAISESPAALFETQEGAALARARRRFDEGSAQADGATWLECEGDDAGEAFLRQARSADLVVVGALEPPSEREPSAPPWLLESVLLRSGRPMLLVPPGQPTWRDDADVLVGWNGSAQAARALAAALPWMRAARRVHLLVSRESADASEGDGLDVRGALSRHGIDALVHRDREDAGDAGQRLAHQAAELGAGLLVMGGYGHGRLQERILGGATAFMLHAAPLPVLMAH
jgi:nucleotide-binding universal stress UspA family protein